MQNTDNAVIIVSGGSGSRMQNELPKQYLKIKGKPILAWTIEKFLHFDQNILIILVLGEGHEAYWAPIKDRYFMNGNFLHTRGGDTRFDSVKSGLAVLDKDYIVGVHDAVRPIVSSETIKRCYDSAREYGSAIPVIDVEDTIRSVDGPKSTQLKRESLMRVQTPQVFKSRQLLDAYTQSYRLDFTDDASVFEMKFGDVRLVEGNPENIKITKPADLKIAAALLV
jgi:2-C-methyl-D-erythritol 4-phosphate cytidylyltransferase